MVIGLEEPILVKGVGEIIAKVDSGNGGYNVIHGEDLTIQGDILTFKTHNKDGEDRRISKKIKDTLNVNIGGGHIQERPVVELDVQFGGQEYKKVLFSVTDRSGNDNKVLISKDFVGKELDALIDVTKNKIADDGIEVEYVSEGVLSATGNAAGAVAKWAGKKVKDGAIETGKRAAEAVGAATDARSNVSKAKKGPDGEKMYKVKTKGNQKKGSWVDRFYAASQRFKRWVDGNGKLFDDIEEFVTGPGLLEKFLQADPEAVRKAVIKETDIINSLGVNPNSIQVYKILDFLGGCCAENKYVKEDEKKKKKELMDELKDAQKQIEELQKKMEEAEKNKPKEGESAEGDGDSNDNKTEEDEEIIIKEDAADASTTPPATQPAAPESPPADANDEASGDNEEKANNNENPEAQIQNLTKKVGAKKEELTKYKDIEEGRDFFVIYYAAFTKTKDGEALSEGKNITMGSPEISVSAPSA